MTIERDIFEHIVKLEKRGDDDAVTRELLALGVLNYFKWDRAVSLIRRKKLENLSGTEIDQFWDECTEKQIALYYDTAQNTLKDFVRRHPPRHDFWFGVGQSLVAAFFYSLALWLAYQLLKAGNIDLFTLLSTKIALP